VGRIFLCYLELAVQRAFLVRQAFRMQARPQQITSGRETNPAALVYLILKERRMLSNRSIPNAIVIPVLAYPDVNEAAAWLCDAFGFSVRLRIGSHRVQLNVGEGAVILREMRPNETNERLGEGQSITIRVEDVDAHCKRAKDHGARITQDPVTQAYGERQYNAEDYAGRSWTFSQSVADVHPEEWGGTAEQL
jgi:uncharacterized glyoxalase superfamily protein PhnB